MWGMVRLVRLGPIPGRETGRKDPTQDLCSPHRILEEPVRRAPYGPARAKETPALITAARVTLSLNGPERPRVKQCGNGGVAAGGSRAADPACAEA
jgi:hypothetical protein